MEKFLKIFKALGDTQRLRIVSILAETELCVCQIQSVIGFTAATISQHLSILSNAGLLKSRKEQKWVFYSIDWENLSEPIKQFLLYTIEQIKEDKLIQADLAKLKNIENIQFCSPN
ncbi:ArsR family transcriptional regulator [Bacteroidetes/Chlorobi group bacterium Naka2016]|jgi:ArsR family transcriptional regulator|nr:MAG: ArsR family transcriptional regulator [Bacteroidetes/Chlorobi group bacterium Naka2016]